ncbi:MAG: hypothetical protein ACTSWA_03390 [Candidatus Thorarchaeota archaeon]
MGKQVPRKFLIDIEKKTESTTIRIKNVEEERFDDAYLLADEIFKRARILELKIKAESSVISLWLGEEPNQTISDLVTQSSHRIALSLFRVYPKSKSLTQVINETHLPKTTARGHLIGNIKSTTPFFTSDRGAYRLTKEGFDWVLSEVIPFLANQTGLVKL